MRRLDQLLANLGYCSRREARAWIQAGRVTVRGEVADDFGAKADPADVRVDGEPPDHPAGLLLLVHKPTGLVCSHDEREGPNVYSLLPPRWRARNPPVTSFSSASRTEASDASSQRATIAGISAFGASRSVSTTSVSPGGPALPAAAGHISATVSARSSSH